jgi:uncharacterized protein
MNQLNYAFTLWMSLLVEAIPFLLLGVIFSSVLLLFVEERKLIAKLPRNPILGAFVGSLIGCIFPVCECGNVPVARRLLVQGVPPPVAIGFLFAAPTVNPIVVWSTWTAFRELPEMVVLRLGVSLGIATLLGWLFSVQQDLRPFLQPAVIRAMPKSMSPADLFGAKSDSGASKESQEEPISPLLQSGSFLLGETGGPQRLETNILQSGWTGVSDSASAPLRDSASAPLRDSASAPLRDRASEPLRDRDQNFPAISRRPRWVQQLPMVVDNMVLEIRELGGVLILGSAIAAIVQIFVPRDIIINLGQGPVSSIIAMLILATVVSICSTVDAFFALSFASTFTTGSLLAFLVFGPMIDIKAIGLLLWIFKPKTVAYLMIVAAQLTFVVCLAYNLNIS